MTQTKTEKNECQTTADALNDVNEVSDNSKSVRQAHQ